MNDEEKKDFEERASLYLMRGRSRAAMDHPFWSAFTAGKEWRVDWSCQTAYTDGRVMGYNPAFMCYIHGKFKMIGIIAIIVHEAAHIFLGHHLRKGKRPMHGWNVACDHVVNNLLLKCKPIMCLDGDWVCDRKYKDWCAEDVYEELPKEDKEQKEDGQGKPCDGGMGGDDPSQPQQGQSGDGKPTPNTSDGKYTIGDVREMKDEDGSKLSEQQVDDALADIKGIATNAAQMSQRAGKLPAEVRQYVEDLLEPKHNWKEALSMFVGARAKTDFNMSKPRPTAACCGYFSPELDTEDAPAKICIGVDTSGSMDFVEACSEVQGAVEAYEDEGIDTTLKILYCDTKLHYEEDLDIGDKPFKGGRGGGGGTRFSPVVDWVRDHHNDQDIEGFVYITDGHCSDFGEDPGVPTLWVLTESASKSFNPPFGEFIHTDIKDGGY